MNSLAVLTGQIEERKRYIMAINNDVEAIQRELAVIGPPSCTGWRRI